ncbi:TIGR00153 family protein [Candidatus Marinamargulisbacteria bacterium SCGC AG-343-D04]|nr:TIGR00153 family protein [Candidatus Marinamargulisbacteria bacterium SCGC AG-343-D04]
MKELIDIFSKSPFGLLEEHMDVVSQCVDLVDPLIKQFVEGNTEECESLLKQISKKEHSADIIKDQIREHLPKSIFMPVSREDVLKLLQRQDNIADFCEDVAILVTVRNTPVIKELKEDIIYFSSKAINTAKEVNKVTRKIRELMETTFSGPRAEEVLTAIENIGQMEWETDTLKYKLVKKMFTLEDKIDPVTQVMFLKIFDVISGIADSAESTSNAIRLMISK